MKPLTHPPPQLLGGGGVLLVIVSGLIWIGAASEQARLRRVNDVAVAMFGRDSFDPDAGSELTWVLIAAIVGTVIGALMVLTVIVNKVAARRLGAP
jgi:hypothetical protein